MSKKYITVEESYLCHCNPTVDEGFCAACTLSMAKQYIKDLETEIKELTSEDEGSS